MMVEIGGKVWS